MQNCLFESNLTRLLLNVNMKIITNSQENPYRIRLDEFIQKIVEIQSSSSSTSPKEPLAQNNKNEINMYDILYIQRFLIESRPALKNLTTSWKHQFLWLNDMFTKLNTHYFEQAQQIDSKIFSSYFFDTLLESITSPSSNNNNNNNNELNKMNTLLSTSLAHTDLIESNNTECSLNKYHLTQQIYFQCDSYEPDSNKSTKQANRNLNTRLVVERSNRPLKVVLFENDKLFPYITSKKYQNYDLIHLINVNQIVDLYLNGTISDNQIKKMRTDSQILVLKTDHLTTTEFNLTLEIKVPSKMTQLLKLIESQVKNFTNATLIKQQQNLFDELFYKASDNLMLQLLINNQSNLNQNLLVTNLNLLLSDESYFMNSIQHFNNSQTIQTYMIRNFKKFTQFRKMLSKYFDLNNYQVIYGVKKDNRTLYWLTKLDSNDLNCSIIDLEHSYKQNLNFYANLKCVLSQTNQSQQRSYNFISLRLHLNDTKLESNLKLNNSVLDMVEEYAKIYKLNYEKLTDYVMGNYVSFKFRIIYFFSFIAIIIFSIQIIVYLAYRKRLMMPRSFFHIYINKWLCMLILLSFYMLGIHQIYLPHVCFVTSVLLHYFLLCIFVWYMLTFYCFFIKLNRCKERNYELIFNPQIIELRKEQKKKEKEVMKKSNDEEDVDDDEDDAINSDDEYIKKPVIYLYMIGYGIPLLLCSIIICITQRDYINLPYNYCFTNNLNILIATLFVPISLFFILSFIFICMILAALKKILKDLDIDKKENGNEEYFEDHYNNKDLENVLSNDKQTGQMINPRDKVEAWNKNFYDQLKTGDLLEVKMNKLEKVSNVSTTSSTSSFFDKNRSILSDQTSIMDSQHPPNVQLKYSIFSLFLFMLICVNATLLVTMMNSTSWIKYTEFFTQLLHYFLSILVFVLSFSELAFYVLSRGDLMHVYAGVDRKFLNYFSSSSDSGGEESQTENEEKIHTKEENNLYFSPPKTDLKHTNDHQNVNTNFIGSETVSSTSPCCSSSTDNDEFKKSLSDALFMPDTKNTTRTSLQANKYPTLAQQEDTGSIYNQLPCGVPKPVERRAIRKQMSSSSAMTTSLYGSATQTFQSFSTNNQVITEEENTVVTKVYTKNTQEEVVSSTNSYNSSISKSKFNELLNNKCSQHTGAAIESIFTNLTKQSSSVGGGTKRISGSSSSHAVDSVISSTETVLTDSNKEILNLKSGTQSSRSESHSSASNSQTNSTHNLYYSSTLMKPTNQKNQNSEYISHKLPPKQTRIYGTMNRGIYVDNSSNINSPLNNSNGLRSSIFRPKEIEPKVETSV
jgi:hypothetical protein